MKIKVGVIFGGKSTEHEVSIISGVQAMNAFDKDKYDVVPIYLTKENIMYAGEELMHIHNYRNLKELLLSCNRVFPFKNGNVIELIKYPKKFLSTNVYDYVDVMFPIVHGTNVEDGTLQGLLNLLDIPYVGCDILSSALGMDKYMMKLVLKNEDVPVLDALCFDKYKSVIDIIEETEKKFKYPVIVKPINLGSSIGIAIAKNKDDLENNIIDAFKYSNKIIIERAIENLREINVSVLGDCEKAEVSVCEEPITSEEILTYENKYVSKAKGKLSSKGLSSLSRKIPAELTKEEKTLIETYALKTFKALGCSGVSRIDLMIDKDTNKIYVNEINTIPGSLSFYLWSESGLEYSSLLDKLVRLALKRQRENEKITYSFKTNILENVNLNGAKGIKKF
ncbi:MAG: D-alanine--D-alanine ligase family protein [Bacilli bacterium]